VFVFTTTRALLLNAMSLQGFDTWLSIVSITGSNHSKVSD